MAPAAPANLHDPFGQKQELEREVLLYFDGWNVQCARWRQWKLHFARYNSMAYNPAPPGGRVNLVLPAPELYNLESDPDESYDAAPGNPQVVAHMMSRVEALVSGFPDEVKKAWEATRNRPTAKSPVGALPQPVKQP